MGYNMSSPANQVIKQDAGSILYCLPAWFKGRVIWNIFLVLVLLCIFLPGVAGYTSFAVPAAKLTILTPARAYNFMAGPTPLEKARSFYELILGSDDISINRTYAGSSLVSLLNETFPLRFASSNYPCNSSDSTLTELKSAYLLLDIPPPYSPTL
jgi:hypothetical protein